MKLQESLKAFVDGELSIADRHEVTKQLETDEAARKAVDDLNRLSASIRAYVTQPEPVGLQATLDALEKAKPKARRQGLISHQLRWVGGFAAAIVLVGVVGSVFFPVYGQSKSAARMALASSADSGDSSGAAAASPPASPTPMNTDGDSSQAGSASKMMQGGAVPAPTAMKKAGVSAKSFSGKGSSRSTGPADGHSSEDYFDEKTSNPSGVAAVPPTSVTSKWYPRTLIQKNSSLTVKVKNVADAQHTVESVAAGSGGYVEHSSRSEAEGEKGSATLTVRVPVQRYDDAIKSIRGLGEVISESSNGNDVTAEVVDMDARLKVLRTEEGDYVTLLARARSTAGIIEIRDKLTEIREEIESIDSQRKSTKDLATYSTINVQLTQKSAPKPEDDSAKPDAGWLNNTWSTAVDGLGSAAKVVAQLFIFVLVWSPIWLPIALLCAWIARRMRG